MLPQAFDQCGCDVGTSQPKPLVQRLPHDGLLLGGDHLRRFGRREFVDGERRSDRGHEQPSQPSSPTTVQRGQERLAKNGKP